MLEREETTAVRRITDLRSTLPGDHTLQNLLRVLNAKLELCAKLPIYEYEAASQGHGHCAVAFRHLAEVERVAYEEILKTLRLHIDEAAESKEITIAEGVK